MRSWVWNRNLRVLIFVVTVPLKQLVGSMLIHCLVAGPALRDQLFNHILIAIEQASLLEELSRLQFQAELLGVVLSHFQILI